MLVPFKRPCSYPQRDNYTVTELQNGYKSRPHTNLVENYYLSNLKFGLKFMYTGKKKSHLSSLHNVYYWNKQVQCTYINLRGILLFLGSRKYVLPKTGRPWTNKQLIMSAIGYCTINSNTQRCPRSFMLLEICQGLLMPSIHCPHSESLKFNFKLICVFTSAIVLKWKAKNHSTPITHQVLKIAC